MTCIHEIQVFCKIFRGKAALVIFFFLFFIVLLQFYTWIRYLSFDVLHYLSSNSVDYSSYLWLKAHQMSFKSVVHHFCIQKWVLQIGIVFLYQNSIFVASIFLHFFFSLGFFFFLVLCVITLIHFIVIL